VASTVHESLLSGLCDEDWDAAHELVKRIVMHVVLASDRPLVLVLDDAHHCDPTSWCLLEWLASPMQGGCCQHEMNSTDV